MPKTPQPEMRLRSASSYGNGPELDRLARKALHENLSDDK